LNQSRTLLSLSLVPTNSVRRSAQAAAEPTIVDETSAQVPTHHIENIIHHHRYTYELCHILVAEPTTHAFLNKNPKYERLLLVH
jgi:hypothetical protein